VFLALVFQHAKRMCRIISVACPALQYFSTSHKRYDFRKKKVIEYNMGVFIFSTTFVSNISHSKKDSRRYYHKCLHIKYPLLADFNETWIFSADFRKIPRYQISRNSVQWEPNSMRTDGERQTWRILRTRLKTKETLDLAVPFPQSVT
jgi:hypothetical protein